MTKEEQMSYVSVARSYVMDVPATNETAQLRAEALRALDALFEVVAQMGEGT